MKSSTANTGSVGYNPVGGSAFAADRSPFNEFTKNYKALGADYARADRHLRWASRRGNPDDRRIADQMVIKNRKEAMNDGYSLGGIKNRQSILGDAWNRYKSQKKGNKIIQDSQNDLADLENPKDDGGYMSGFNTQTPEDQYYNQGETDYDSDTPDEYERPSIGDRLLGKATNFISKTYDSMQRKRKPAPIR